MSAHVLLAEIDGVPVPLADCGWALIAPCGCCHGVTTAGHHGKNGRGQEVRVITEDDAWWALYDRKQDAVRDRSAGYRVEFMTIKRIRAEVLPLMTAKCPHEAESAVKAHQGEK